MERYSKQILFGGIGPDGQEKIATARVTLIGAGATGCAIANNLCRSGVGFLRIVDPDRVELSNLQRQLLYDETDAENASLKAAASGEHLRRMNSEVIIEPVAAEATEANILPLIAGSGVVMDGTDNMAARYLINGACCKLNIPWVYTGAIASRGMTFNVIPGKTACFECIYPCPGSIGKGRTADDDGILIGATVVAGSVASVEALKILIGSPDIRQGILLTDVWENTFEVLQIAKNPECPTCGSLGFQ